MQWYVMYQHTSSLSFAASSEMQMFMRENTGLIAGLVVISVILVVITLAFVTIIIWNRKHNMRPTDKQDKVCPHLPLQI